MASPQIKNNTPDPKGPVQNKGLTQSDVGLHRKKWQVRLMFAAPILTCLLVLLSGIVLIQIFNYNLQVLKIKPESQADILFIQYIYLFIATLLAGFAGLGLSYVIVRPLRQITEMLQQVSHTPSFDKTQVDLPVHEEIGKLQDSYNQMLSSLQQYVHERNKYILESLAGGVLTLDTRGIITTANKTAESALELSEKDLVGKSIFDIFPEIKENHRVREIFRLSLQNSQTFSSEEMTIHTKHQKIIPIGISLSSLKEKNGNTLGIIATFKDLTRVKMIHQQLQRSDRLAAIGTLATGLAHEIRNPLGSMKGLTQLIQEDFQPDDPKRQYTQVIIKEVDRLNLIVEELLSFSRATEGGNSKISINKTIRDAIEILKHDKNYPDNIEVIEKLAPDIPLFWGEHGKLFQAFLNVLRNAVEAILENNDNIPQTITVQSLYKSIPGEIPNTSKGRVIIEISNTGSLITPDKIEQIFDPFYTTKTAGTGLGLAITHQIIAAHSGMIEVTSQPSQPTVFRITLPMINDVTSKEPDSASAANSDC